MNSVILTGKYNKEYRLHTIQNWRATCKPISLPLFLSLFEKSKATVSRVPQTRAYGMSNTGALRIHSYELNNSTDRLTESETLMRLELMKIYLC